MTRQTILAATTVAAISTVASADYYDAVEVGYEYTATDFGGVSVTVWVVDVYMRSNDAWKGTDGSGDTLLNVYNWNTVAGAPTSYFQSFTGTGWTPTNLGGPFETPALLKCDSFVTIGCVDYSQDPPCQIAGTTGIDPNFGGNNAAAPGPLAGWYNGSPPSYCGAAVETTVGIGTFIGRFASLDGEFSLQGTTFEATWNQGLGTPGQQAAFIVTPAPGAMAMLGLAGIAGRRRRHG